MTAMLQATTSYGFSVSSPPTNLHFRQAIIAKRVPLRIPSGHRLPCSRQFVKVSASLQGGSGYKKGVFSNSPKTRESIADWVSKNDDFVRRLPIYVGGISLLGVLFNRTLFGIAPVADASSSQSRADLLTIGLAVTNILAGLVWLSIRPKTISVVPPRGVECERMHSDISSRVASELKWAWESLSTVTCSRSLVIVYDGICILQIGYASVSSSNDGEPVMVDSDKLMQGSIYQSLIKSGTQSYLANLSLYPGKSELPFLPSNTQAVILQPLGDRGIAILGGDTIRGFTTSDQAWITLIGEKLDATLSKHMSSVPLASSKA
uniref:protein COFACTOR ASSEMBLY OF COMPLEX C SUBUNIT B CCB4, chloroplastic isoform X2 n=1 Tax=Erigeron canadensis TaxID=72917 RepID=UPI001CB8FBAB|nr:protein COFACTOR ASSEMBLY OF COMPLEX C SUBUNIT B CCB4, chloroplastic isoform X2 [Erigeron canadensis]